MTIKKKKSIKKKPALIELQPKTYKELPETVHLSNQCWQILQKYPFVMVRTDTGSGKTYIAIRTAALRNPEAILLVFAPKSKVEERAWEASVAAFNREMQTNIQIFTTSYSTLTSKNGIERLNQLLTWAKKNNKKITVIADEAQNIKLSSSGKLSQRNKAFMQLAHSQTIDSTIGLSATPSPNSYLDVAVYLVLAGFYPNVTQFIKDQIVAYNEYHAPIVKDPYTKEMKRSYFKDPDKLDQYLSEITVYTDTEHLLPPVKHYEFHVELDDNEQFIHPQLEESFNDQTPRTHLGHYKHIQKLQRDHYFEYSITAIQLLRNLTMTNPLKAKKTIELLNPLLNSAEPQPVLLFYQYKLEKQALENLLKTHFPETTIQCIDGQTKETFEPKNPNTAVLIQYRSGGAGLEMPSVTHAIFFGPTHYSQQDFHQAKGRNRRAYSTKTVHQSVIKTKNTIDELIWKCLEDKQEMSQDMLEKLLILQIEQQE